MKWNDYLYYLLQIGSIPKRESNMSDLDIDVTKSLSSFLYYSDIVMNYAHNELINANNILNYFHL